MSINNKKLSTTLLCVALGGGYSLMKKYVSNVKHSNDDNTEKEENIIESQLNINNIFDEEETKKDENKNNKKDLYSEDERKIIFNNFKSSFNTPFNTTFNTKFNTNIKNKNVEDITFEKIKIETIKTKETNYTFETIQNNNYKITIEFDLSQNSFIPIKLNNFNYIVFTKKTKIIFDNIIFKDNKQHILIDFDDIEPIDFIITIQESNNDFKNGIIIINNWPYYLSDNYLPNSLI
jgi:hypothetical protein